MFGRVKRVTEAFAQMFVFRQSPAFQYVATTNLNRRKMLRLLQQVPASLNLRLTAANPVGRMWQEEMEMTSLWAGLSMLLLLLLLLPRSPMKSFYSTDKNTFFSGTVLHGNCCSETSNTQTPKTLTHL